MNKLRKYYIMLIFLLLGAKLLDKQGILSPLANRLSYGDFFFFVYLIAFTVHYLKQPSRLNGVYSRNQKYFFIYLFSFSLWTGISWCVNSILREGNASDFFGIPVRVAYYAFMALFVVQWVKEYGPNVLVIPFCVATIAMFYFNFTYFALEAATIPVQIGVKNFAGVLMPTCAIYFALSFLYRPGFLLFLFFLLSLVSTMLIYSLGGIVLVVLFLPASLILAKHYFVASNIKLIKKNVLLILLIFVSIIALTKVRSFSNTAILHIKHKISNIPGISQSETESGYIRIGHFLSSVAITLQNPLFGVGEANWQDENNKNKDWLGVSFLENENPHNGVAQMLSMFGIPAFILFAASFYYTFKELYLLHLLKGMEWKVFVISVCSVFVGIANLMSAIFTSYFFYFFAALVFGIKARRQFIAKG